MKAEEFKSKLMEWWAENKREFPWRKTRDPYAVLIAEFLLQKTDAKKAESAYSALLNRYPSVSALAEAEEEDLKRIFRSIGLVYRADRVKRTAVEILEKYSGQVPRTREELLSLPGVGKYTANAVLCFAYGKPLPLIDAPTSRVLARVFNFRSSKKRAREDRKFWEFAGFLVPPGFPREYNFALLDFADAVCAPKKPKCSQCPLKDICSFFVALSRRETAEF